MQNLTVRSKSTKNNEETYVFDLKCLNMLNKIMLFIVFNIVAIVVALVNICDVVCRGGL